MDIDILCKRLEDSQEFMDKVTTGFSERNENIFYRKPKVNTDGRMEYADLVDNTLASYLEKMPKNIIQKMPTFTLDAHNRDKAEDLVYEYIAKEEILGASSSKGYSELQKQWITARNGGVFGACAAYLPFMYENGSYTVGYEPIYWGDLYPEAYTPNLNRANYVSFRTLKTEQDLQNIIDGEDSEVGGLWDRNGVQTVLDYGTGQSIGKQNVNQKVEMAGLPDNMYELFIYTDKNWVITFHYASKTILRTIPNISGCARVVSFYSDYDGSSVMGRSLVDMAYAAQQALTSILRNFIYTADYNTDPSKFVKGINLDEDTFNLTKGNTMFLNDEDGDMKLLPIDTTTVQQFPSLYSLLKTVLLTSLPSSNDTGISSEVGDPTYSKTQAGVNSQTAKAEVDNNYYRKNYEQFFELMLENRLNIYLAEVRAIAEKNNVTPMVTLNEEYANLIREVDPNAVDENNRVRLDMSDTTHVSVSVDFESTRDLAKEDDLKRLNNFMTGFFEVAKSDPSMSKVMRPVIPLLMEEMAKSSNLENSAKIVATMKQALNMVEQQENSAQPQEDAPEQPPVKPPTVSIAFKDLPPAGKIQAAADYGIQLTAEDVATPLQPQEMSNGV